MLRNTYLFEDNTWNEKLDDSLDSENTLVICFGSSNSSCVESAINDLNKKFSTSVIIGCSTAGEIYEDELYDSSLSVAVIKFEKTKIKLETQFLENFSDSFETGIKIAKNLNDDLLKSIFVLSDGLNLNGSKLTKGINSILSSDTIVSGGLAGDDANFEKTWVLVDGKMLSNYITAVGLYGDNINISTGSQGGWSNFGINRVATNTKDNIVYSLDNKPALEVYKTYLGDIAKDLPASGLMYPLMIKEENSEYTKVRTILAVNEEDQSITFAGDIPNNSEVMFMKASFSDLIEGASISANILNTDIASSNAINIAISCIGRKLVLGQKTEDELEAVLEKLPEDTKQIGFYSYGEISPLSNGECELHNQTMTLTMIWES